MDAILSILEKAGTASLIYSALGAHSRFGSRELPTAWFIAALEPLGHGTATVRQTLYRMEKKGDLDTRKDGRQKLYRLSAYGQAAVDATYRKMTQPGASTWDGNWSIAILQFSATDRILRNQMRSILELEGFASISRGVYVHPQDRLADIREAARILGRLDCVLCFRGERHSEESDEALVARLWDIEGMDRRYRDFLKTFSPVQQRRKPARTNEEAFALRLALAICYSEVAWDDPELPEELLPHDWAGTQARATSNRLYPLLLPGTLAHGDNLLARLNAGCQM